MENPHSWTRINQLMNTIQATTQSIEQRHQLIETQQQQIAGDLNRLQHYYIGILNELDVLRPSSRPSSTPTPTTSSFNNLSTSDLIYLTRLLANREGRNHRPLQPQSRNRREETILFEFDFPLNNSIPTLVPLTPEQIETHTRRVRYDTIDRLEKPTTCPITQQDFASTDEVIELNICHHLFQPDAILRWLERNPTCPVCRSHLLGETTNTNTNTNTNTTANTNTARTYQDFETLLRAIVGETINENTTTARARTRTQHEENLDRLFNAH